MLTTSQQLQATLPPQPFRIDFYAFYIILYKTYAKGVFLERLIYNNSYT